MSGATPAPSRRNGLVELVRSSVAAALGAEVGADQDDVTLARLGLDSFHLAMMFVELEAALGTDVPPEAAEELAAVGEHVTIRDAAAVLDRWLG